MTKLYAKIERIAQATVRYYESDIAIHDKGTLAAMQPGDTALWACRESGSHLAFLDFADREMTPLNRHAATIGNRNLFRACNKHWPGMQWHLLTVTDHEGHGTVTRVSVKKAERLFEERLDAMSQVSSSPRD